MRTLYFDCFAGASGDMIVAALLDAGAEASKVQESIDALSLDGVSIGTEEVTRASIRATKFEVVTSDSAVTRNLSDIEELLSKAPLVPDVRERARRAFRLLADAEAAVHGVTPNEVHFHEVGALDAIVDVVAACAAFSSIAPELTIVSPVAVGRGWVSSAHGPMPSPAPAVVELLKGVEIVERWEHETVTPTGAALLRSFADRYGTIPHIEVHATGYGAGSRQTEHPNVLRVLVGESVDQDSEDDVYLVETNIDDMTPELFPYVIESLIAAGAQDAWTTPITMKKGRHAVMLSLLARSEDVDRLTDIVFRETTTFGIRRQQLIKEALDRKWVDTVVFGHPVRVKIAERGGDVVSMSPEYEDAAEVARQTGRPLKDVYAAAIDAARSPSTREPSNDS